MGRRVVVGAVALTLFVACSDSGGGSSASSSRTSTTTSTTVSTTSTTSPEEAVKAAYLAYWTMIDRLSATPDPDDPELLQRVAEPLLSFLRDDMATRRSEGRTTRFPSDPSLNSHRIDQTNVQAENATIEDCFVDGRIAVALDGTENADVVTKQTSASLVNVDGVWKVSDAEFVERTPGVSGCAAR
jgi:hypothetical protein